MGKVSIVPRADSNGITTFIPEEDTVQSGLFAKQYLLNKICIGFGSRAAETLINGENNVTSSVKKDLEECTQIAKVMVENYGMAEQVGPIFISGSSYKQMNTSTQDTIDEAIDSILREQFDRAKKIISENRPLFDRIVEKLLEQETMTGEEVLAMVAV